MTDKPDGNRIAKSPLWPKRMRTAIRWVVYALIAILPVVAAAEIILYIWQFRHASFFVM
jgi:uncharacterized membrane protein